ncbi:MAG: PRC-barrel domain-containing protein [Halioglobus sp.]|nr:PRC-barrel domain-containing protein [Halioglobus sp.]
MLAQLVQNTLSATLLTGGLALSMSAVAAQGLYSADDLLDADVYASDGEEIGEVEDLLLGDDMSIHSLVIELDSMLGMGGREVVAMRGTFTVRPEESKKGENEFGDIDYEVHLDSSKDAIKDLPEYSKSWWQKTQAALVNAWEETMDTSESAWESTKEATSSAWHKLREGAEGLGDDVEAATD